MQTLSKKLKAEGKTIGFVPTMGALHEGHLSLARYSKDKNDATVFSIYVNPVQFGPKEDFRQYPRNIEGDLNKLYALHKIDAVFIPDDKEIYSEGPESSVDTGRIGEILCGVSRPGHFNAVATVVANLFNIVMPDRAYFGQKDFQQTLVIKKLVKNLEFDIEIIVCPTIREPDGLAMSSRNSYLNHRQRKTASVLYRGLKLGSSLIKSGSDDLSFVKKNIENLIKSDPSAIIEYIIIADPRNLEESKKIKIPSIICLAVNIGETRLIDNLIVQK